MEAEIIERHVPCEECGSSDAKCVYDDGHSFCFSCATHKQGEKEKKVMSKPDFNPLYGEYIALKKRGLTEETCKKFGYQVASGKQVASYKRNGELVGQKIRTKDKKFSWIGSNKPGLYGQHLWKSGGRKLVITEGEIDAMTVSQIQDHKWPVVSLPHGAAAATKAIKSEIEWIESFDEVVMMYDMDEPGQKAAYDCAALLTPGKAKIANLPLKDPNEMLIAGRSDEIITAMWNAKDYQPDCIIDAEDLWDEINKPIEHGLSYPWPTLTKISYGIRPNEIITLGAGTGIGKTTLFRQMIYHMLTVHNKRVACIFGEETAPHTVRSILGLGVGKPIHKPGIDVDASLKRRVFDELFGHGKLKLLKHFQSAGYDGIKGAIKYLAMSGYHYIFLDHITALVSGGNHRGEREELDRIMTELSDLVVNLGITLFAISHVTTPDKGAHEEGARVTIRQFRGSRAIGQWSNFMIALEGNQQGDDPDARVLRVLKDRYTGEATGVTIPLHYDHDTMMLSEADNTPFNEEPIRESDNEFDF
jgi:twinkle protein